MEGNWGLLWGSYLNLLQQHPETRWSTGSLSWRLGLGLEKQRGKKAERSERGSSWELGGGWREEKIEMGLKRAFSFKSLLAEQLLCFSS